MSWTILRLADGLQILKKYGEKGNARAHAAEIESFTGPRPLSPSSSTSSYHSSQVSLSPPPPAPPSYKLYSPPDPSEPIPDVAPDIVPPSALNASHRSLLNLMSSPLPGPSDYGSGPRGVIQPDTPLRGVPGSRAHSLRSEGRKESVHSLRMLSGLGLVTEQHRASGSRPYTPVGPAPTIRDYNTPIPSFPFLEIQHPTPTYPARPASVSTYSQMPQSNIPHTLQQIQISLTALHERLSTLERSQAMLLRREDRRRGWSLFGGTEADELDEMEDEAERSRWHGRGMATDTATASRVRRRRSGGLTLRVVWFLIAAVRRAMLDVGVGMLVMIVAAVVLGGGWRRARTTWARLMIRARRFIQES